MNKQTQKKLLNLVKQNYEEIADDFSNTRNYIWPELRAVIAKDPEVLRGTKQSRDVSNVLDLGCGNGRLFELFKDANVKYTGIEQSHKLAEIARQKYPKAEFIESDILKYVEARHCLAFAGKHNLVLLIAVLSHIPSHKLRLQLLQQIKNHLAKDGQLIITVWDMYSQPKFKKLIWKYNLLKLISANRMDFGDILFPGFNKKSLRYYHTFTQKSLAKLLKQAGFQIEKLYSDTKNIYAVLTK